MDVVLQPEGKAIIRSSATGDMVIMSQGKPIPLVSLDKNRDNQTITEIIVVTHTPRGYLGLLMDEVIGQQQVVMKPLIGHLKCIPGGVGCALLPSGEVAIALDADLLMNRRRN